MTEMLSIRCIQVLQRNPEPMTGMQVAGQLKAQHQVVTAMLTRLCGLRIVSKKKGHGDCFKYKLGPEPTPDNLGELINGQARRKNPNADGPKRAYKAMTWAEMVKILPEPESVLAKAYKAICAFHVKNSLGALDPD